VFHTVNFEGVDAFIVFFQSRRNIAIFWLDKIKVAMGGATMCESAEIPGFIVYPYYRHSLAAT